MNIEEYRARATKAEQVNAELKRQLDMKPKYSGFVTAVYNTLKMTRDTPNNQVIQKIKQLMVNKDLYAAGSSDRRDMNQEKKKSFEEGRKQGLLDAIEKIKKESNAL